MDALIHTWDLATATGASGLDGPAVVVPDDASAQDLLQAAMRRRP